MPIYEYVCNECGHTLEALQKLSDAALQTCPACAKDALKKKISAPGFRLSGSGWYETDFKSKNQKNLVKGESSENSSSSNKDKSANTKDKPAGDGTTKASGKDAAA
jgi:putative FmdB family regulatory protein